MKKFDCIITSVHLKATGLSNEDLDQLQAEIDKVPKVVKALEDHYPGTAHNLKISHCHKFFFMVLKTLVMQSLLALAKYIIFIRGNIMCLCQGWVKVSAKNYKNSGLILEKYVNRSLIVL